MAPAGLIKAADGLERTVLLGLQCVIWDMVPAAEPLVAKSCPQGQLALQRKRHLVERIGNGDILTK